ncbi:hypothetical protein HID58_026500, partial [Brassica napus]
LTKASPPQFLIRPLYQNYYYSKDQQRLETTLQMTRRLTYAEKGKGISLSPTKTLPRRIRAPDMDTTQAIKDNEQTLIVRLTNTREQKARDCPTTNLPTYHQKTEKVQGDYARKLRADNQANSTNLHYKPLRTSGQRVEQQPFSQRRDRHGRSFGPRLSTTEADNADGNKQLSPSRRWDARPSPQLPPVTSPADSHSYRRNNSKNVLAREEIHVEDQARRNPRDIDQDQTQTHTEPEHIIPLVTRKKRGRPSGKTATAGKNTGLSGTGPKKRKENYPSEPEQSNPGPKTTVTKGYYSNNRRRG